MSDSSVTSLKREKKNEMMGILEHHGARTLHYVHDTISLGHANVATLPSSSMSLAVDSKKVKTPICEG